MFQQNYQYVKLETLPNNVLRVTLNRPELHNAFNEIFIEELTRAFLTIPPDTRAVILTGEGKSFSAGLSIFFCLDLKFLLGADLNWMKKMVNYSKEENLADALKIYDMVHAVKKTPVPVIGRINGAALGGGVGLVAACDVSFARSCFLLPSHSERSVG